MHANIIKPSLSYWVSLWIQMILKLTLFLIHLHLKGKLYLLLEGIKYFDFYVSIELFLSIISPPYTKTILTGILLKLFVLML